MLFFQVYLTQFCVIKWTMFSVCFSKVIQFIVGVDSFIYPVTSMISRTIFDVDIDGFEEKPWKYPGVDITDFFNFGLNEESWKDYCKQLVTINLQWYFFLRGKSGLRSFFLQILQEQHRLETTMQSKIRVYESGRDQVMRCMCLWKFVN